MTEKRFYIDDSGYVVIDNNSEKAFMFDTIEDCYACCDVLNEQHKENQKLKDALWIAETEYINERYFDNPIRKEESINELKEDFKRGYWND